MTSKAPQKMPESLERPKAPASPPTRDMRVSVEYKLVPVGLVRHVHYHGIARNSEECEVVLYDNAKNLPEGTLLYAAPQSVEEIGEVVVSKDKLGNIVSVTRQDAEGRVLSVIAESDRCDGDCDAAEQQPAPPRLGLVEALEQIERWDGFPSTDEVWEDSGEPVSYGAAFGSNGERDFMREVARKALVAHRKQRGEA